MLPLASVSKFLLTRFQPETKSGFSTPTFTYKDKHSNKVKRNLKDKNPNMYTTEKVPSMLSKGIYEFPSLKLLFTEDEKIIF